MLWKADFRDLGFRPIYQRPAGNRLPRGDRASGDLEPPALEQRNRLDLERGRERPRRLCNVPQLHLGNE
jgi:hypothetical protein